jgi:Ca2+-binding EF-hand superfamily protein
MRNQFRFHSTGLRCGIRVFVCGLLANGLALHAQDVAIKTGGVPALAPGGAGHMLRTGGQFNICINGSGIGAILQKACDSDQDSKVTLTELKDVTAIYFKSWDSNADDSLSADELSTGVKALFPAPPAGAVHGMRMINGAEASVSSDDFPTPSKQLAKHILSGADSNKEGSLSLQELSDFLDNSFGQWDQSSEGSLDATELDAAFAQLAMPDLQGPLMIKANVSTSGSGNHVIHAHGGEFGLVINGSHIGAILQKACDSDQDGKVTLTELKEITAACFKLWDTNSDSMVSGSELSTGIKDIFPAPTGGAGGMRGMPVAHGAGMPFTAKALPSPDAQLAMRVLTSADADKEGSLSLTELNDFLDNSFSQWDQSGDDFLDAAELRAAFGQLAIPELPTP